MSSCYNMNELTNNNMHMNYIQETFVSDDRQGRNEVRWRHGQETSLAPPCSNLRSFGSKCAVEETTCDIVGIFRRPRSDSAPGDLRPFCPRRYSSRYYRYIAKAFFPCRWVLQAEYS